MARPSDFTPELGESICSDLADGNSLRTICKASTMPGKSTVLRWLAASDKEGADESLVAFRDQYARAREEQADLLAADVVDISDEAVKDAVEVARNRLRVDARKWYAGKVAPKKYGDKVALTDGDGGKLAPAVVMYQLPDNGRG